MLYVGRVQTSFSVVVVVVVVVVVIPEAKNLASVAVKNVLAIDKSRFLFARRMAYTTRFHVVVVAV